MSEREKLMKKIAMYDFAALELHIFLDTHPNDTAAANKLDEYTIKSNELKKEYESKFGPIDSSGQDANRWAWISNPWPWDAEKEGQE